MAIREESRKNGIGAKKNPAPFRDKDGTWKGFVNFEFPHEKTEDFKSKRLDTAKLLDTFEYYVKEFKHKVSISYDQTYDVFWFTVTPKQESSPSYGYSLIIKSAAIDRAMQIYVYLLGELFPDDDWCVNKKHSDDYLFT